MKYQEGISVIIPMYNAQLYIERCIKSVLLQGNVIYEIICVDDGSTDQTCHIVKELQNAEAKINLIRLEHAGVSHARNIGKIRAIGRYIMYIDADDYLLPGRMSVLYKKACSCNADILVFGGCTEDRWHAPEWVQRVTNTRNHSYFKGNLESVFKERGVFPVTWNKLYKREYVMYLDFPEELSIAEDNVFQFWAFLYAEKVIFVSTKVYMYCINENSVMVKTNETERLLQHKLAIELIQYQLEQKKIFFQYEKAFLLWKELLEGTHGNKKNRFMVILSFIKNYGLRSAFERAVGKYIIK